MSIRYQELPQETARAARSIYSRKNAYLTIGNQVDSIIEHYQPPDSQTDNSCTPNQAVFLALVTAFQCAERLTDTQATNASRLRLDWKYALHLPVNYPGLNPDSLCNYRHMLQQNQYVHPGFQHLLERLASAGVFCPQQAAEEAVPGILHSVCTISRMEWTTEAMRQAVETLAMTKPQWLVTIALPHWFRRYDQGGTGTEIPEASEDQEKLVRSIGSDIKHLLENVANARDPTIGDLPEIQNLRRVWIEQYENGNHEFRWRTLCKKCEA